MKNGVLQEQYEKLFETLHETRRTQTRELVAHVDINHHLGAPQHGGSPPFDMGIPDEERVNHQNIDQHETSLNPDASTRSRRSEGRHLIVESPLPRPRSAVNLGKERQVPNEHEGTGDSEVFRQTRSRSQYGESKKKPHALAQTFLLPRGDGDKEKFQWYMTPLRTPLSHSSLRK
ncbi:hypothetical protein PS2_012407 [Malus domestica]